MRSGQKFFICKHCGNMVGVLNHKGAPMVCCGEKMTELVPNTAEASTEKHLPVVTISDNVVDVQIGSALHPMEDEHYIGFVYVETELGGQRKSISPGGAPKLSFSVVDDKVLAVYAYCNLHGLWKTDVE